MPKDGYKLLQRSSDHLDTSVDDEGENRANVSEVQFSFFEDHEGSQGLQHFRRRPEISSVRDRLRSGFRAFAEGQVTLQMLNLVRMIVYLSLLGVIPAAIIFLIDLSVHMVSSAREAISVTETGGWLGFFVYILTGVVLCLLSTLVCRVLSVEAEGSGIPQMKAIMSGFYDKYKPSLSMWALLAKSVGLICAIGGGLPVGWEGPNVHIACIIAHHLSRLPMFRVLRKDRALRLQFMVSACSVGLASSFGTPIGGVLYALETTSSYYLVPTFWKSILATLTGAVFYDIFYKSPLVEALDNTQFDSNDYQRRQLLFFAFLGVIMGVAGAFFVKCVKTVYDLRSRIIGMRGNRYIIVGGVALVSAALSYHTRLFRLDPREAINEMFSSDHLKLSWFDVFILLLIKFPLVVVSIGLPVPAGVFIPCFLLGSAIGRLYGEVLKVIFGSAIVPGGFAVVGAAAFTAGVTRALSCAVVLFEVTGQLSHVLPSLLAVLLAVIVGNGFGRGLYDTLIIMKKLAYMPHMRRDLAPTMTARQVMDREVVSAPRLCTVQEAEELVRDKGMDLDSYPVVGPDGGLIGSVRRSTLVYMIERAKLGYAKKGSSVSVEMEPRVNPNSVSVELDEVGTIDVTSPVPMPLVPRQPSPDDLVLEDGIVDNGAAGSSSGTSDEAGGESGNRPKPSRTAEEEDRYKKPPLKPERKGGASSRDVSLLQQRFKVPVDLAPLAVTDTMLLGQLHFMFVMLMPTHALVLSEGRLIGVIRRKDIIFTG
eukprot:CAMPEP_0184741738 /NCGR_PEP_ID=MMETSP0315-20130426/4762_1 /TAXON_ID=101924 /ORGANISM="Rhodosorus marinus, Strain UTEX LB 2760" /LENGTH=761 /DNA_ID=CAMNT_0027212219 /DNA_START=146 /DNA_END=2431 /DNA_ORIENTATION=-